MPELPDVKVYVEALRRRVVGTLLRRVRIISPFVLRSFEPPIEAIEGASVHAVSRLGKRIVLECHDDLFLIVHLMIAGRFRWAPMPDVPGPPPRPGKIDLAQLQFSAGSSGVPGLLTLTEASPKKRASIHLVRGREALEAHAPRGLDVLTASTSEIGAAVRAQNRTLKRALTNPRILDGIGNAYSDEVLHAARLSPTQRTANLSDEEVHRLAHALKDTLSTWTRTLLHEFGLADAHSPGRFPGPGDITAFRPDFAVHGKFNKPCPACGTPVQRIVYAENECNYCPHCQTAGNVLADRSLSRLLGEDWPRTLEELEDFRPS
jgi:formamidopyrimidine-DNA glycosylase